MCAEERNETVKESENVPGVDRTNEEWCTEI